jgi:hypothetical protein
LEATIDFARAGLFRLVSEAKSTLFYWRAIAIRCEAAKTVPAHIISHTENIIRAERLLRHVLRYARVGKHVRNSDCVMLVEEALFDFKMRSSVLI